MFRGRYEAAVRPPVAYMPEAYTRVRAAPFRARPGVVTYPNPCYVSR